MVIARVDMGNGDSGRQVYIEFLLRWFGFIVKVSQQVIRSNPSAGFLGPVGFGSGNGRRKLVVFLLPDLNGVGRTANEIRGGFLHRELTEEPKVGFLQIGDFLLLGFSGVFFGFTWQL
jgi:hypothetical protein